MWEALWTGQIAGSPYTDLYSSVWSLWATESWWGTWNNQWFNYPSGQPWSPSTLFWGTVLIPLKQVFSISTLYNISLLSNRLLSCLAFYLAGRQWNQSHQCGLLWMIAISMTPMIHGFAVEGILEGTQLWPLGLWLWSIKKHWKASVFFGALVLISNWYWALCWGIIGLIIGWKHRRIWLIQAGSVLVCLPWILHFLSFQKNGVSLDPSVYRAMGFQMGIPTPNLLSPPNPFAISNYLGWIFLGWAGWNYRKQWSRQSQWLIGLGLLISWGFPWMQNIPIVDSLRFPYRIHLLTLIGLCWVCRSLSLRYMRPLLYLMLLENLCLSGIDWKIPSSSSKVPDYTTQVDGPVLELPGPLSRKPGEFDPSRPRMKYLQYYQTQHQQPSPWSLHFNGLIEGSSCFSETRMIDPHARDSEQRQISNPKCWDRVQWVVIHTANRDLDNTLPSLNFHLVQPYNEESPALWRR